MEILRVVDLKTHFHTETGIVKAVDGVSFSLKRGETLGILGESGAGKSVTTLALMGMTDKIGAFLAGGSLWYNGEDLFERRALYKEIRGKKISLIPQEVGPSLNPVLTVGDQIREMITVHLGLSLEQARKRTLELLNSVELRDPAVLSQLYPFQLSGGMLQRVVLAMALSCNPEILIADEPASSLDTTIQSQVLKLLRKIKEHQGLSTILISHDLGIISGYCDRVMIMYSGRVIEIGPVRDVINSPGHPYTASLIKIYRSLSGFSQGSILEGGVLSGADSKVYEINGCGYATRCPMVSESCISEAPVAGIFGDNHIVYCHRFNR